MPQDESEVHWFKLINNSGATQRYIMFAPPPPGGFDTPIWIASDDIENETSWEVHTTAPIWAGMSLFVHFHDYGIRRAYMLITRPGFGNQLDDKTIRMTNWADSGISNNSPGSCI